MHVAPVPHDNHRATQLAEQGPQECCGALAVHVLFGVRAEVERQSASRRRQAERGNQGHLVTPLTVLLQDGRLATGSQTAAHQRRHQQAAFVDQNEVRAQSARSF